jgi:hypothetical protein
MARACAQAAAQEAARVTGWERDRLPGEGRFGVSPAKTITMKPSLVGWLRLLIVVGVLAALVIAGAVALIDTLRTSRNCHGGFSRGFSAGFDTHRCEIILRLVKVGTQIMIPVP